MTDKEKYLWDLNGHLIVRDVLSQEEIDEVNQALDYARRDVKDRPQTTGGDSLRGTSSRWYRGDNLLNLSHPHCDPFRKMLAHPVVVQRLVQMCGPGVRLEHGPQFNNAVKGTQGLVLHGAGNPHRPYVAYHHQNGSGFCNGVTVTWNLTDCPAGGGGFACVPGSHKSKYPVPDGVRGCDADMGTVIQPEVRAGDVLFFMDGAQTHGTHPWQNDHERRSVLFKYAGRTAVRSNRQFASPEVYWEPEIVEGMTAEELAVMWGPFVGGREAVPVLVCEEDGTVHIEDDATLSNQA
jgi:ectoine hydroxylase-related dioxygenase (phytanoyl-CoA dioxygenase family)